MIVSGVGHVCSHVIACFLLKFPCQTHLLLSLSLASYSACQRGLITATLVWLVPIMGPSGVPLSCRPSGSCALWRLGCQEWPQEFRAVSSSFLPTSWCSIHGCWAKYRDKGDLTRAWPASWFWIRLKLECVLYPHPKYFRGNVTLVFLIHVHLTH